MKSLGSLVPVGLIALALGGGAGCKKDDPPKPDPSATAARPATSARGKLNMRNPMGPMAKIDPQAMKDYRLDVCYYGTLALREARDAYLASLGKDEPSEKKIPSFGIPTPTAGSALPATSAAPSASAAAKAPAAAPKPSAAPSASAAAPAMPERPRNDFGMRVPHERNARACTAAVALKEPAMGDVDAAVNAYATFAVDLAKDITAANAYYTREDPKKDNFAKGKELDKKLREEFGKLDELQTKLGDALNAWRKAHPLDTSKMDEGEKISRAALDDARDVYLLVVFKKADGEAWKAALDKLDKSAAALKTYADAHGAEPWAKIMAAPFEIFTKSAKEAKVGADKTFDQESYINLAAHFTGLIEARQRALSRNAMARPQFAPAASGAAPAPAAPEQK